MFSIPQGKNKRGAKAEAISEANTSYETY